MYFCLNNHANNIAVRISQGSTISQNGPDQIHILLTEWTGQMNAFVRMRQVHTLSPIPFITIIAI